MSPCILVAQSSSPLPMAAPAAFGNDSRHSTVASSENETEDNSTSVSSICTHDTSSAMLLSTSLGADSGISSDSNNNNDNLPSSPAMQNLATPWKQAKVVAEEQSYGGGREKQTDYLASFANADSDELLMEKLNELLQSETSAELRQDSGLCLGSVDDLFPSLSEVMEFPQLDPWSAAGDIEYPCPFEEETTAMEMTLTQDDADGEEDGVPTTAVAEGMEEEEGSVSQMFAQWLRSNSNAISLSDLRKIKLKTSTIERATRRLGGGKKGLMLFVKFVLRWVQQNCYMKQDGEETELPCDLSFLGPFAENSYDRFSVDASSCRPSSPSMAMSMMPQYNACDLLQPLPAIWSSAQSFSHDWSSPLSPSPEQQNTTVAMMRQSNGCGYGGHAAAFPYCLSDKTWIEQASALRGNATPASTSCGSNLQHQATGHLGGSYSHGGGRDTAASLMMMMQQQKQQQQQQQQQDGWEGNPARSTRAARKSRMERQRWSVRRSRKWSAASHHHHHHHHQRSSAATTAVGHGILASWPQIMGSAATINSRPMMQQSSMDCDQQYKRAGKNLRLLFHKELKQSDVGNLGRIVLPKKAAESCLPPLESRNGMNLTVEDLDSPKVWNMRYRFWPNNKSRMYILENTGDFVKSYNLKEGDYMLLYYSLQSNRYMVRGAKGEEALYEGNALALPCVTKRASSSNDNVLLFNEAEEGNNNSGNSKEPWDDGLLVELIEQSLEDFRDSSDNEPNSDAMKMVN